MTNPRDVKLDIVGQDKTKASTDSAARNYQRLAADVEKSSKKTRSASDRILAGAKALRTGALIAAAGLAKLGFDAVKNASDSEQSIGATQQIFGKHSKAIIDASKKSATQYGLSANAFRESSNLIGSLFKNQGVASDQLAAKTQSMIGLGADLSAVFGGPASDAVDALGSAFKGEFDPLQRYGITLTQNAINAEAMRVAHVKNVGAFGKLTTAQQIAAKQQATTNLITQQSTSALGQFAAQSGTTAEQTQILKAKYTDLSAQLGAKLLPIINRVLTIGLKLLAWSTKHQAATIAVATAVGVLTGGILLLNLAMLANPVGLVIVGVALLAAGFVYLWKKSETFRDIMKGVWKVVITVIRDAVNAILTFYGFLLTGAADAFGWIPGIGGKLKDAAAAFNDFKNKANAALNGILDEDVNVRVNTTYAVYGTKGGHYVGSTFVPDKKISGAAGGTFAVAAPGGSYRTGGPTPVTVTAGPNNISTAVYLDGHVIRSIARTEVNQSASTQAWRARTGRR